MNWKSIALQVLLTAVVSATVVFFLSQNRSGDHQDVSALNEKIQTLERTLSRNPTKRTDLTPIEKASLQDIYNLVDEVEHAAELLPKEKEELLKLSEEYFEETRRLRKEFPGDTDEALNKKIDKAISGLNQNVAKLLSAEKYDRYMQVVGKAQRRER